MSSLALSVLLSLISAVAYAAGAIIQERVAATGDNSSYALLRNRVWWVAVLLNGIGAVLHVVALAYGPLSLVQPLGALTIVFALPMAALFVGRRAGATAWRGALMATAGLCGLLALTGEAAPHTLNGAEQFLLATVTFGGVGAIFVLARALRRPVLRSIVLATGAGAAFGMASVFTKTVAMEWTSGSVRSGLPTLLVIAVLAAAGLLLSQAAYRGAGLTAPLATVTVVNPVVAAAVGITLFGEHFRGGWPGTALALSCGALAAAGLVLLTRERLSAERARERLTVRAGAVGAAAESGLLGTVPEGTVPGVNVPDGTVPGSTAAEATVPEGAAPGGVALEGVTVPGADSGALTPDGALPLLPGVPEPAGRAPVPHTSSLALPPGRAVPGLEFGGAGALGEQRRRAGRGRRSERTVQTLMPPARR
ncbi:DMT family transporter [Streptomyces sp. C11-1]|uniref:DMT family transporter n=1 Tax=Streptomyces durocortorensis TaxID=2811104 RepID=A0ABY9W3P0_9ACTN|nr:DMT family transporter [Streptomyces durocortorensis]WNF30774.1 DMT family transporter [Streptomyces durocortorensis]